MVSTRQMSSVSNGAGESSSSHNSTNEPGPSKYTRYNTVITTLASQAGTSQTVIKYEAPKQEQTVFLMDMPPELIEKILSYLPFKAVAHLRTVSILNFN